MEGDLANCDITKNLGEIRCFFKPGAIWSDGTKITVEDALATYSLLAETDTNKKLQSSLSKFAITREDTALVFRSTNSSIETLQLLTIPVIKKSVSERIRNEGKFQEEAYSGPYKLDKRDSDSVRMSDNVILVANDVLQKNGSYSRIILKVYSDKDSLAKQKDSLNLVFPSYYDDVDMGQRFSKSQILTPDFVGAFLNSERITLDRRKVLSGVITKIIENSEKQLQPIKNPFFTDSSLVQPLSEDVDADLKKVGYLRKKDLPKNEIPAVHTGTVVTPVIAPVAPKPEIISTPSVTPITTPEKPTIKTLSFITAPSRKAIVSLPFKTEIQIEGNVPKGVTAVFVNGYQLKGYTSGDSRFVYRARTEIGNLKKGSNTYSLAFEKNGKKETMESIIIHNGDGFVVEVPVEKTETPPPIVTPPVSTGSTSSGIEMTTGSVGIPSSTSSDVPVSHTGSIPTTTS